MLSSQFALLSLYILPLFVPFCIMLIIDCFNGFVESLWAGKRKIGKYQSVFSYHALIKRYRGGT